MLSGDWIDKCSRSKTAVANMGLVSFCKNNVNTWKEDKVTKETIGNRLCGETFIFVVRNKILM